MDCEAGGDEAGDDITALTGITRASLRDGDLLGAPCIGRRSS